MPRRLRSSRFLAAIVFTVLLSSGANAADSHAALAQRIIKETGVSGGFVVHLGCGDGKLTAALRAGDSYQVQGLDPNPANVAAARKHVQSQGKYGDVAIDRLRGKTLPYIVNLVNLLVAEDLHGVSLDEVRRVLVPEGVAYVKQNGRWTKIVKPRPKDIDDWTHYLHDSTGNAVAKDKQVGPPRHMQWLGTPRWSRHHDRMASMSALVSAGGRIFYVMDEGSRISIQLPPKWKLIARDAFNGTILWKRDIPTWQSTLWPLKSGPTQLSRRLVATKDHVFLPLGFEAPLTMFDAKTGKTIRTLTETKSAEEVILNNSRLFVVSNPGKSELADYKPKFNVGDQGRVRTEFLWNGKPRNLLAIDVATGKTLWKTTTTIAPITLAADDKSVYFFDGGEVVGLSRDGKPIWKSNQFDRRKTIPFNFGPRLVVHKDVVLFAGGDRKMAGLDANSGKTLWSAPHDRSGYESPEDLLVVNGLVWTWPTTRTADTGMLTGLDPKTGEVKSKFAPKVATYWFHHRCYIAKATENFIIPSRTGVEFVDLATKNWEIHHWVRGGCLYGVMPANGLLYAPPHNCACYPEAKLYGFNVLAAASKDRPIPLNVPEAGRLETGPAFGKPLATGKPNDADWPTYRHDNARSGVTKSKVGTKLASAWNVKLGGRLTQPVVADGKLYVAQVDRHTVHAMNADSGKTAWTFTAGGRVDSPPTIESGRVLFGCADGWVYCLRSSDGALTWRYRAAPLDRRLMAFEQLESVWPVHGSVLVQDGVVFAVAGRSNFLDGGLRMVQLDLKTGKKRAEAVINDRNPVTGKSIQDGLQILQMAVGLPDILSSDGKSIYMRSQRFDLAGKRTEVGPVSGQAPRQGAAQKGEGRHLFAPMGFLDDTWFHRAYWVYGKNFAGGHNGYYQAGKYTPSGRMVVKGEGYVYGFARKPQYYRWTTTIEHQLFAAPSSAPDAPIPAKQKRRGRRASLVRFAKTKSLDPTGKAIVVEAWINAERPNGTVVAHGGPADGYALVLRDGQPRFVVRRNGDLFPATAKTKIVGKWTHVVGMLTPDKQVKIYVNGKLEKSSKAAGLLEKNPVQSLEIGADDGSAVGQYRSPYAFRGVIDQVKVLHGKMSDADVAARFKDPALKPPKTATPVLSVTFDDGKARDGSGQNNHGTIEIARSVKGKIGSGLRFLGGGGGGGKKRGQGSFVKHVWNKDLPLLVRAMALADTTLFVAGPPDLIDEEKTFKQLMAGDEAVQKLLQRQDDAIEGKEGGILWAVDSVTGEKSAEVKLPGVPVWDGLIAARGRLYLTTIDGRVTCIRGTAE
jgi:outer membrane protein assembly factor BamB